MSALASTLERTGRPLSRGVSFVATFRPAERWNVEIQRHAGVRCGWIPIFVVEDGPCAGQFACVPSRGAALGLAWAPESELVDRDE